MSYELPIAAEAARYRMLRQSLIDDHGLDESDEVLLNTLDGETDIMAQLATMLRRTRELDRFVEMVAAEQRELATRKHKLEEKAGHLRRIVCYFLDLIGRKRIEVAEFSYTLAKGRPSLVGDADPNSLPDRFCHIKRTVNRTAIYQALKDGALVEGFSISQGAPHLRQI